MRKGEIHREQPDARGTRYVTVGSHAWIAHSFASIQLLSIRLHIHKHSLP